MITREVRLHTGIVVGEGRAMVAEISEDTVEDELTLLSSGVTGLLAHRRLMMSRVKRLGDLVDPSPKIVAKLTRTDWELIERALRQLDLELGVQAGLYTPDGELIEVAGGREQPGGAAPGDA